MPHARHVGSAGTTSRRAVLAGGAGVAAAFLAAAAPHAQAQDGTPAASATATLPPFPPDEQLALDQIVASRLGGQMVPGRGGRRRHPGARLLGLRARDRRSAHRRPDRHGRPLPHRQRQQDLHRDGDPAAGRRRQARARRYPRAVRAGDPERVRDHHPPGPADDRRHLRLLPGRAGRDGVRPRPDDPDHPRGRHRHRRAARAGLRPRHRRSATRTRTTSCSAWSSRR